MGRVDNWEPTEQTIPFSTTATSIAFLGAAAAGPSSGEAYVRFSDGSVKSFTLTFSDWTLGGGSQTIAPGDTVAVVTPYRNTPSGKETVKTYVFMTSVSLPSGKSVVSVTLPERVSQGAMHIFAVGAGAVTTTATVKGISNDSAPAAADFDGGGRSYSNNALAAAGLDSGAEVDVYGFTVKWPVVAPTTHDNWGTYGAVMPLSGSGTALEILGAAVGGASSGTATITYADGTTRDLYPGSERLDAERRYRHATGDQLCRGDYALPEYRDGQPRKSQRTSSPPWSACSRASLSGL